MARSTLGITLTGACLAGLAGAAPLLAADTTIRVEGGADTLISETTVAVDPAPVTVADAFDADAVTLPGTRATAQLGRAASAAGVPLGLQVFSFGTLVQQIGSDASPSSGSPFWRLKVNDATTQVGSDELTLGAGDRVTWAFLTDFATPELDLRLSRTAAPAGARVTARVTSFANDGTGTPAAGALVRYGARSATTGADGLASFVADGVGTAPVSAVLGGAVRSEVRRLCTFTTDPAACGVDPAAPACRPAPPPGPARRPDPVRLSAAGLLASQRVAQAAIRRVAAIERWLDAGLVEGDLCGGAVGPAELGPGVFTQFGGAAAPTEASPRPVVIPGARRQGDDVALSAAQLRVNQRIAQVAVRRANAVTQRLALGLTGGDVRDGEITAAKLARGLTVTGTTPAPAPPASATPRAGAGRPPTVRFTPTAAQLRVNQRIARTAVRRTNAVLAVLRAGIGPGQIRDGSITAADLAPALRSAS